MLKPISIANMMKMKHSSFDFEPPWSYAFSDEPSDCGFWIIWGKEKNGKTWFALLLAKYLASMRKVLYISAEEGLGKEFVESCKRAGVNEKDKNLTFVELVSIVDVREMLKKRNAPDVIFFDNVTVYADAGELKNSALLKLKEDFPNTLFIFLAHEDRGEPKTSYGRMARIYSKIIVYVEGLKATVSGRVFGGEYVIDEAKAALFWGTKLQENE